MTEELKRLKQEVTGSFDVRAAACEKLDIRLPIEPGGDTVMLILVDKYGNEKKVVINSATDSLVPKLQLGNPNGGEALASRDLKPELPVPSSQAGAWELAKKYGNRL